MASSKGMPPGASQGIVAAGPSNFTKGVVGTQFLGHSPMDIGAVAPCDDSPAPVKVSGAAKLSAAQLD